MGRHRAIVLLLVVLACTAGCVEIAVSGQQGETYNGTVTHVVDGDTIDVRLGDGTTERIRLLGIDTPEVHVETQPEDFSGVPDTPAARACLRRVGENASEFVIDRLAGERVRIETDPSADRRGDYDRLLAYVSHDGRDLNHVLVVRGYAGVYPTTFRERERFEAAVSAAMSENRGLWRCRNP